MTVKIVIKTFILSSPCEDLFDTITASYINKKVVFLTNDATSLCYISAW